ncbi:hypothetical protein niasHT_027604 [Heterodera trifolii]|uniref:Uncharacterized protein n=1 Tax=Heterodera trifolii TaxID=157864 RepID=A0ABD2K5J4_9BILA
MIPDSAYIEIMKNCSKWNSRTMGGRTRSQTAVFDQQTGIVHRPTEHLFRHPSERCLAQNPMQVFTYPPVRWVKPKNNPSAGIEMNYFMRANPSLKSAISSSVEQPQNAPSGEQQIAEAQQQIGTNVPSVRSATGGSGTKSYIENELDLAEYDLDELETNDQSDEEDWGASRKKRKKTGPGLGGNVPGRTARKVPSNISSATAKKEQPTDNGSNGGTPAAANAIGGGATTAAETRPYVCQLCGAKYKSRPGLAYHKLHVHQSDSNNETPKSPIISPKVQVSEYCDFCLGTNLQNAEGEAEPLISCHDCGRSGHPTCLKFTKNMLVSTKRYGWQCIECKSCAICGTSENDDQLLFCDDCDRGFHLYCLKPPLKEAPETDWSCHLCVKEFGAEASIAKATKSTEDGTASPAK